MARQGKVNNKSNDGRIPFSFLTLGVLVMRMLACWRTTKAALMLLVAPVPSPAVKSQNVCCEIGPGLFVSKRNRNAQFPPAGFNGSLILPLISIKRKMERHGLRGWAEENIAKDLFCFFLQMLCEIECEKCNCLWLTPFLSCIFSVEESEILLLSSEIRFQTSSNKWISIKTGILVHMWEKTILILTF